MDDYTSKSNTVGFVPVGGSTDGRIELITDGDWLRVDLLAGVSYQIDIFGIGSDELVDPKAQLRTADFQTLVSDNDGGEGTSARLLITPTISSSYYVQVSDVGRDDTGDYRVALSETGSTSPPSNPTPPTEPTSPTSNDADLALDLGVRNSGSFGNKFNNQSDADGVITATFENTGGDATLSLTGFDIDFTNEVEVRLNGQSLGFLTKGPNNGLNGGDSFSISAAQQQAGTNIITFEQNISNSYKWGGTDIELSAGGTTTPPVTPPPTNGADIDLVLGQRETGSFGNKFDGQNNAEGVITASFENTGGDATLSLTGFDIDFTNEVEVKLNGQSLGFLAKGANNELNNGDSFSISAAQQQAGTNIITFEQNISNSYKWGVTDIELSAGGTTTPPVQPPTTNGADIDLVLDQRETGSFGNKFDNQSDADGVIKASFENTGGDARLSLTGFDVDFTNEIEVSLNGQSLGFLSQGPNNGLNGGDSFSISASQQQAGTNTITFEQNISDSYKWGVTDIIIESADNPTPPPGSGGGDGVLDVMLIGDSFSIPGRGLPGKIEAALENRGYGETEIIDLTKSGRNVFQARDAVLEHFDDTNATIPEVAILAIGINDALQGRDPADQERVLNRIVDELQNEGVEVLLAVPEAFFPLKPGNIQGFADQSDQDAFKAVYDDVASDNGLVIARDFIDGLIDNPALLQDDIFHPNQAGTDRILDNLLPEIEEVIERALPDSGSATTASVSLDDIVHSDGSTG